MFSVFQRPNAFFSLIEIGTVDLFLDGVAQTSINSLSRVKMIYERLRRKNKRPLMLIRQSKGRLLHAG